jgi:type III pantothenate kinase
MQQNVPFLAIDCGNTQIKIGVFLNGEIVKLLRLHPEEIDVAKRLAEDYPIAAAAMVSVAKKEINSKIQEIFPEILTISSSSALPYKMRYETPYSLGLDRMCNAAALYSKSFKGYKVAIDIGTCVKFDVLDDQNNYLGGSISPGIGLRYRSLNDYTAQLPLLNEKGKLPLIGKNSIACMQSGVINGLKAEIDQFIAKFEQEYHDLTFFVTGGDANSFDFAGKNNIFVDENLTLKGLEIIYSLNA